MRKTYLILPFLALALAGCEVSDKMIQAEQNKCSRFGHTGPALAECVERGVQRQQEAQGATANTFLGVALWGLM